MGSTGGSTTPISPCRSCQRDHLSFPDLIQCMIAKGDPWFSWLVNPVPPSNVPAQEIACLMIRAYENHWFPLRRPAIKPLFLRRVREGGRLTTHDFCWGLETTVGGRISADHLRYIYIYYETLFKNGINYLPNGAGFLSVILAVKF